MLDSQGNTLIFGSLLQSSRFMDSGPTMFCHGFTADDGKVILAQQRKDEMPIHLTQEELLETSWIVTGHKS